ncbi:hypothetical protein IGI04_000880, partial [Brassica rapa subsp. trilocularis]
MEQMKSSVHPGDENKGVVAENLSSVGEKDFSEEAIVVDDNNELNDMEEEVNVCDTCGVLGFKNKLAICHNCGVGAEHTYCMAVKLEDVSENGLAMTVLKMLVLQKKKSNYCMVVKVDVPPEEWICYDCTEDRDGVPEGEETSSMERRVESYIDFLKVITTIIQRIYTQKKLFLTEEASSQADLLNRRSRPRMGRSRPRMGLDLNKEPNPDFEEDPNIGL